MPLRAPWYWTVTFSPLAFQSWTIEQTLSDQGYVGTRIEHRPGAGLTSWVKRVSAT